MSKEIHVYDRRSKKIFIEKVFGDFAMRCAYGNPTSAWFTSKIIVRNSVSRLTGKFYDSKLSKSMIPKFVLNYKIKLNESQKSVEEFLSFNDFFARTLTHTARPICENTLGVASPGDGRLLVFPKIENDTVAFVKWAPIRLIDLFNGNEELVRKFQGGSCAILRLCPSDYHRFHFPVAGTPNQTTTIKGLLHSVNPYALELKIPVYCMNKRTLCEFKSEHFGSILILEVGAFGVGSIVQTYNAQKHVNKGAEKGFFKFGGSTTILFFEKDHVLFDTDLIQNSEKGIETLVQMGEQVATKVS